MTALTSPKGPLPARVYWFRRVMALSVLFVLVFGTSRLLGGEGDAPSAEKANIVSAPVAEKAPAKGEDGTQQATAKGAEQGAGKPSKAARPSSTPSPKPTPTETPKPSPTGACSPSDVVVTPSVAGPRTSLKVKVNLTLRSSTALACTFEVSPKSVVVKIDSCPRESPDDIWSSAQCTSAVPTKSVTVYKDHDTVVPVTWSGRRSDSTCSDGTGWAKRGWYHVNAATYGGEPQAKQFELTRLSPVTVTRTVEPKPAKTPDATTPATKKPATTTASPDGAVEPDLRR